jgi:hypothetical protein
MKILCLEQGDWVKPTDFPTNGPDWEARRYSDFHISPNRRARDTDYPINESNSVMKVANFNGVGGGTILYMAHFPRLHDLDHPGAGGLHCRQHQEAARDPVRLIEHRRPHSLIVWAWLAPKCSASGRRE